MDDRAKLEALLNTAIAHLPSDNPSNDATRDQIGAFQKVVSEPQFRADLLSALPVSEIDGGLNHEQVFSTLEWVSRLPNCKNRSQMVVGEVWRCILESRRPDEVESHLVAFSEHDRSFWTRIRSLPMVLPHLQLRTAFACTFLKHLSDRVSNDGSGHHFWNALQQFIKRQPRNAIELLRELLENPNSFDVGLAAFLLGTLRHQSLTPTDQTEFVEVAALISNQSSNEVRTAFYRSWATTAWQSGVSQLELQSLLASFELVSTVDQQELIGVIARIASARNTSSEVKTESLAWLTQNAHRCASPAAKYAVINLIADDGAAPIFGADSSDITLLLAILPIPVTDKNTWDIVEAFLVKRLESDLEQFATVFLQIATKDPDGLLDVIQLPRSFEWLKKEMSNRDMSTLVTCLLVSTARAQRHLGFYLFDELELDHLAAETLEDAGTIGIGLSFYECQRMMMKGESLGRFLASLLPFIEAMSQEFQKAFFEEVSLQCQNRGGGTRSEIESRIGTHKIVASILKRTSEQFEARRLAVTSAVSGMSVPGYERAGQLFMRRQSEATEKVMEEHSIWPQLCKFTALLYAKSCSAYSNGRLTEPSALKPFESSVELPIIDFADPEGMRIRRLRASQAIAVLEDQGIAGGGK